MRNHVTKVLILVLASAAPALAQSGTASRSAVTAQQRAFERQRAEVEAALQATHAHQAAAAERQHLELEALLQAARSHETAVAGHAEVEAALLAAHAEHEAWLDRFGAGGPPASWAPQDPADSLWRKAREQLNAGDHAAAAQLFHRIRTEPQFAKSAYRPDAFYWEAFALARRGGTDALRQAKQVLEELEEAYQPAQRSPDARALATRIDAELAGHGSLAAARELQGKLAVTGVATPRPVAAARAAEALATFEAAREAARISELRTAKAYPNLATAYGDIFAGAKISGELATTLSRAQSLPFKGLLNPQCQNDEEEIRLIALNALVEMEDSAALPALREVLARRDECAPQLRRHAMMILARRASPGTEALALEAARHDPDPEVRQMALTWLIEKDNAQAFDVAQELLRTGTDRETRQVAIMALARSRSERARQILREFVRSDAPVELRGEALMALPLTRDAKDATFLRQVFGETQDRQLKEYALMALGRRALEGEGDWLLGIAQDESEDVELRTQALWMLRSDEQVPAAAIAAVFDRPGDRRLREAALMIISERSRTDAAALDKLITVARDEPDAELRKQAVMQLVRSKEPRAQAVLLEILRKR